MTPIQVISIGTQGPAGPPSLSPDGIITTEGDLIIGTGTGAATALPVGDVGQRLVRKQGATRPSWQPDRVFDIGDYGASTDGTGDNTAAVLAAMAAADAAGGGTVWLPQPVDYLCTTVSSAGGLSWIIPIAQDNITFDGVPNSGLKTTADASLLHMCGPGKTVGSLNWDQGWNHGGNDTPTVALHAMSSATEGDDHITLSTPANASGYAAGDAIYIRTGHTLGTYSGGTLPKAETNEVVSADADTGVITLRWPLCRDYAAENYPVGHALAGSPTPFGCANAESFTLRNVTLRNIRLISTAADREMMPNGQVIGLTVENVYVESAGHFFSLNDIRLGRYRNNTVKLTGTTSSSAYWWFTTATGTVDVEMVDNNCSAAKLGSYHIHEGSTNVTIKGGVSRMKAGVSSGEHVYSIRSYSHNINVLNTRIVGHGTSGSSIYVDETCDTGIIEGVIADGQIGIGGSRFAFGGTNRFDGGIFIFNDVTGGPIADGIGSAPVKHISGWLADTNTTQILGYIVGAYVVTNVKVIVKEAFNSGGSDLVDVGKTGNQYNYVYAFDVSAVGNPSGVQGSVGEWTWDYLSTPTAIIAKYTAGGSAPTTGKAFVIVTYAQVPYVIS